MDVSDYIRRAAKRAGYKREFFLEKNMPTHPSNVVAIPFYGDLRSTFILSSLILKNYRELNKDKYMILCSWPGMRNLFPYVDEYWSIEDESVTKAIAMETNSFYNGSSLAAELTKSLVEVMNIIDEKDIKILYENGFTKKYWERFNKITRYLPEVSSSSMISADFRNQMERNRGQKIVVYPAMRLRSRQQGRTVSLLVQKDFWVALIDRLIMEGYMPVVYQNNFTYDMSREFTDRCIYLVAKNIADVLAGLRYVGCVLDIHSDISRIAIAARCPFVSVIERQIYIEDKEYEIDDLCCDFLPKQYIFGFATHLITGGPNDWKLSIIDNIMARLKKFVPSLKGASLPSTNESFVEVSHERVREYKAKRMGVTFINSSKHK